MNTNNWIDVKKHSPPYGQPVIVYSEDRSLRIARYWNTGKWTADGFVGAWVGVTHWQPLPEPPPKPDAFEEFWENQRVMRFSHDAVATQMIAKHEAKFIWDTATKAAKEGK